MTEPATLDLSEPGESAPEGPQAPEMAPVVPTTTTLPDDPLEALREPFPLDAVGILPKPYKRDSQKGDCAECGGYHGLPAAHLDYVGHAAVTDRLLSVDPEWNWEPLASDVDGLPLLDAAGGMWIKLTIAGVTRLGYGDGPDPKVRIGDAIRNASMRFGVALGLWTKDELESLVGTEKKTTRRGPPKSSTSTKKSASRTARASSDPETAGKEGMTTKDRNRLTSYFSRECDPPVRGGDAQAVKVQALLNLDEPKPLVKLTVEEGAKLFDLLGIEAS